METPKRRVCIMTFKKSRTAFSCLVAGAAALITGVALATPFAQAQDYPVREVTVVVPFAPGGSTDQLARIISEGLSDKLGKRFLVENVPGAGGNIAMGQVARSKGDGYTLLVVSSSFVVNPSLYKSIPYDPATDFEPISYIASAPSFLVVNPALGVSTSEEFLAKAKEGGLFYSSPGVGTAQHLAGELLKSQASIDLKHIPYNGAGPSVTAVLSNEVPVGFASVPSVLQHVESGALKALAVTTLQRSQSAPDVPTLDEAGVKGYEVDHLQGFLAPKGTPKDIVEKLSAALSEVLADETVKERLDKLGFVTIGSRPDEFRRTIGEQVEKWKQVIETSGVSAK